MKAPIKFQLIILLPLILLASCYPAPDAMFTEFYVSVHGDDASGDGSMASPWRHVQYALDNLDYGSDPPPRLNILRGLYDETLTITRSITIKGAGEWGPTSAWPSDPNYPNTNVSQINRILTGEPPERFRSRTLTIRGTNTPTGNIVVNISDMVFWGGNVYVEDGAAARFDHVQFLDVRNYVGLSIKDSPLFAVRDCEIITAAREYSDFGIEVDNSIGVIERTWLGDFFDHVIDIGKDNRIIIDDIEIHGSRIWYADGIRIRGANNITVKNSSIVRDHPDPEPATDTHSQSGISISGWTLSGYYKILLENNTIAGFNWGLDIAAEGFRVSAAENTISGLGHPVKISYHGYTGVTMPIIDFGGGSLGSAGGNTLIPPGFGFSFFHGGPYDISACGNDWGVADSLVDSSRIYDQLDDAEMGRVQWQDCSTASSGYNFLALLK
ncbi:MAG: right-handed parallel beta-helix repeat-containing protein [Anaerolineae bacterium]|nr:right-handed parallel beta-helix repeat-containing protein [Anaerolineae bacterium]